MLSLDCPIQQIDFTGIMKQIAILIIMSIGFLSCSKEEKPQNEPLYTLKSQVTVPEFNGGKAYDMTARQVAFGPRNPGSKAHQQAIEFFLSELGKYADEVKTQNFTYPGYNENLNLTNIIAKFNPAAKRRVLLTAHWDSRPWADQDKNPANHNKPIPGANDGASGVGVLLELARVIKSNPLDFGVDIVLFDGEDYGRESDLDNFCLGSKYFAATKAQDYEPVFGILLDLVGDKEAVFAREYNSSTYAPDIVDLVWNIASQAGASAFSNMESGAIYDDHIPLNQAGIRTIDIIDADLVGADTNNPRRNYWHTMNDTMENISRETLQQTGNVLVRLLYSLQFTKPSA